ncbi:DUF4136 domain-containing protein [Deminuibacter soli]|uniref:DUF4136 domain-containing protein n=1 Tax=Deminuibacter soli TaxID=2291815 RepID=A0A3E1NHH0_9BACT|nr:DUF4136 domain-containing protein [Deminuibacter soli]RFM27301.1 DUF4136 domain-containing protein [Deminuibacter soli]
MKRLLSIAFAALLVSVGCSPSLKVSSDYDKSADFSKYKTFSLYPQNDKTGAVSELNQNRINSAIKAEMTRKGYQEDASGPDVLVNVTAILKDRKSVSATTDYYGYGGYYRPYAWGGGMGVTGYTSYNVQNYKDGSLIIDVVDANSKKLLWQGVGNSEIDKPIKDPDTAIPAAITKIMAQFPPPNGKK